MNLYNEFNINYQMINKVLRASESFDIICRKISIKDRSSCMFFIDGLVKDDVMEKIMEFFFSVTDERFLTDAHIFAENCVPYVEVDILKNVEQITTSVLSGMTALVIDGFDSAIMIDSRTYPQRQTAEPEKDKVMRGSKDGFVETMISNLGLVRRRIRNPNLTVKPFLVGEVTKTDVSVVYMDNLVDKKLLKRICEGIKDLKVDSLAMNQQSLIEALYKHKWYNPLPKIKYTERPDTTATAILDGNIVIFVDNSPSALILPTSIFDIIEEADDYYFPPVTGTYIRFTRYIVTLATLLITPVWLLALQNSDFVPQAFRFILLTEPVNIPVFWQLMLLELAIDGLRLASIKTPNSLSASLSIIGAIALSEFAVDVGWFSKEAMLYMAFVVISNYTQPSYELGYALKFFRILILVGTVLFNFIGFVATLGIVIVLLITNKTVSGKSYLYPLIPFNAKKLWSKIIRKRV